MKPKIHPTDNFFLHPPWGLLAVTVLFLLFGISFLFRCSELGDGETMRACRTAVLLAGFAGIVSLIPVLKSWGGSACRILISVTVGAVIRLLIGLGGIAIILYFTSISPLWLIVFFGCSYGLFLLVETAISVWLLKTTVRNQQDDGMGKHLWHADRFQ